MNREKLAADTKGVVTPANAISAAGAVATLAGLNAFERGEDGRAAALVGLGRAVDLLDGPLARATNTASAVGEALDAGLDKMLMGRALLACHRRELLSDIETTGLLIHSGLSSTASIMARAQGCELHPSRAGKQATALEWTGIGLAILAGTETISSKPKLAKRMEEVQKVVLWSGIILGTISAINYIKESQK